MNWIFYVVKDISTRSYRDLQEVFVKSVLISAAFHQYSCKKTGLFKKIPPMPKNISASTARMFLHVSQQGHLTLWESAGGPPTHITNFK